jgi:hypothetical protein
MSITITTSIDVELRAALAEALAPLLRLGDAEHATMVVMVRSAATTSATGVGTNPTGGCVPLCVRGKMT